MTRRLLPVLATAALTTVTLLGAPAAHARPERAAPAPTPHHSRAFAPVAVVGSTVVSRHGRTDLGIDRVGSYVDLRGTLLVATTDGHLYARRAGHTTDVGDFDPTGGVQLVADRTARYAEVVSATDDPDGGRVQVYDARTGHVVADEALDLDVTSTTLIDRRAFFVVDHERLVRIDLATGRHRVVRVGDLYQVGDVVAERLVVFRPGGYDLRPVAHPRRTVGHAPLGADILSPSLHWGIGLEHGDAVDVTTGRSFELPVPGRDHWKVDPYGWVGPDTVALQTYRRGKDPDHLRIVVFTCDLAARTCRREFSVPTDGFVQPGGFDPASRD